MVEIVPEAPGGKLISKSRWGGRMKRRGNFFFSFHWREQKGGGQLTFYSIFSGGKNYAGHYALTFIKS